MGSAVLSHCMKLGGTGWRYPFHYKIAAGSASRLLHFPAFFAVLQSLKQYRSIMVSNSLDSDRGTQGGDLNMYRLRRESQRDDTKQLVTL